MDRLHQTCSWMVIHFRVLSSVWLHCVYSILQSTPPYTAPLYTDTLYIDTLYTATAGVYWIAPKEDTRWKSLIPSYEWSLVEYTSGDLQSIQNLKTLEKDAGARSNWLYSIGYDGKVVKRGSLTFEVKWNNHLGQNNFFRSWFSFRNSLQCVESSTASDEELLSDRKEFNGG